MADRIAQLERRLRATVASRPMWSGVSSTSVATCRRDWFTILRDLLRAGVNYSDVARKCNRDASTVGNWANGSEPKESDARIVLAMYAKHCPTLYAEHQKGFEISVEIANVTDPGETRVLPFVGN